MQFNFVELEQARLDNVASLSGVLSTQHKGAIALLTTDNLPYYWNGSAWKSLANSFLELSDTDPTTYSGTAGQFVHVNSSPNGLQFSSRMFTYGANAMIEVAWQSGDALPTMYVGSTTFTNNQKALVVRASSNIALDVVSSITGGSSHTMHVVNDGGAGGSSAIFATTQATAAAAIYATATGVAGYGIRGEGATAGLYGYSNVATGVRAEGATYGFYGTASGISAKGISTTANGASAIAVEGIGGARGGSFSGTGYGVYSSGTNGPGVYATGVNYGVQAVSGSGSGAVYGVHGSATVNATTTHGVYGSATTGTTAYGGYFTSSASNTTTYGVYASATAGATRYGGYFESAQYGVYAKTSAASQIALYADASSQNSKAIHAVSAGNTASYPTVYIENTGSPSGTNVAAGLHVKITTATNIQSSAAIFEVTSTDNGSNNTYAILATARNEVAQFTATNGASATSGVASTHKQGYAFSAHLLSSASAGAACAFFYNAASDGSYTDTRGIYCKNSAASYFTAEFINTNTSGTALHIEGGTGTTGVGIKVNAGTTGIWNTKRTKLDQQVLFTAAGYTAANGNNDNINIPDAVFIRITGPTALYTIRGIANGADGRFIILANRSGFGMTLANQNANSTAANRIITGTGGDIAYGVDTTVALVYDNTATRWLVINA